MTVKEVVKEVIRDREFYEESGGGVTISGGEPLMQEAFLLELLKAFNSRNIHTALDTCGYSSAKTMQLISGYVDLFLYDLKPIEEKIHQKYTGVSNKQIHENLKTLIGSGKKIILRIPVIPGITDTTDNLESLTAFISGLEPKENILEIDLLPYHAAAREKYIKFNKRNRLAHLHSMRREDLDAMKSVFEITGLPVKAGG